MGTAVTAAAMPSRTGQMICSTGTARMNESLPAPRWPNTTLRLEEELRLLTQSRE